ncbi:hypothetical protein D1AOALGA4SA_6969, partial [Olavius algarvensis Delta 1 endosymbiont]
MTATELVNVLTNSCELQRLLQKCSFCSPIRLAVFGPEAAARVKLQGM